MLNGEKIVVVMPAYNAARTLRQTYEEVMAHGIVDHVILVDDASHDDTVAIARTLDRVQVEVHPVNLGYGANQKTCYRLALAAGADIIIMIHSDYQYTPQLIPAMVVLVASGLYACVLASRILGGGGGAGRNAVVEIHRESVPYVRGESSARRKAFRVPHRLSCIYAKAAGTATLGHQLGSLRF